MIKIECLSYAKNLRSTKWGETQNVIIIVKIYIFIYLK